MKVIQPGHVYELSNKGEGHQTLTFFKDLPLGVDDNHDGVLIQEVLRAVLDRLLELYGQKPCQETHEMIVHGRAMFVLAEKRAFGNTLEKAYAKSGYYPEQLPTDNNGHIFNLEAQ